MPHVSHLGFSGLGEGANSAVANTLLSKSPAELRAVLARSQQQGGGFWGPASERCRTAGRAGARHRPPDCTPVVSCWWVQGTAEVLVVVRGRLWGCCGWEKVMGDSWCLRCCCLGVSVIMGGGKCGAINGSYGFRDNLGGWK